MSKDEKKKTAAELGEEAIAQALGEGTVASGAGNLPPAGMVPLAITSAPPAVGEVMQKDHVEKVSELGRRLAVATNPRAASGGEQLSQAEREMIAAFAAAPPIVQPSQIAVGKTKVIMPPSVISTPAGLHATRPHLAKELWRQFMGPHRAKLSQLAAKAGHPDEPFTYFNQAVWRLLELENFRLEGNPDAPFTDKDQTGIFYKGLKAFAGTENTKLIVRACEYAGVSIFEAIRQFCEKLEGDRVKSVTHAQILGSQFAWDGSGDEDGSPLDDSLLEDAEDA